jgi:hypothetical protein
MAAIVKGQTPPLDRLGEQYALAALIYSYSRTQYVDFL